MACSTSAEVRLKRAIFPRAEYSRLRSNQRILPISIFSQRNMLWHAHRQVQFAQVAVRLSLSRALNRASSGEVATSSRPLACPLPVPIMHPSLERRDQLRPRQYSHRPLFRHQAQTRTSTSTCCANPTRAASATSASLKPTTRRSHGTTSSKATSTKRESMSS